MRNASSGLRFFAPSGLLLLLAALAPGTAAASPPRGVGRAAPLSATAPCVSGPTTLCLNSQRFKVEVRWKDFQGNTGAGQAVSLTGDTGYFWFFSSSNVELVVKAVDGRAFNSRFWVFYGALSNVEYTMTVTDSVTGNVKTYVNPSGTFGSVGDTAAFPGTGAARSVQHVSVEDIEGSAASSALALRESLLPAGAAAASQTARSASAAAAGTCVATETSLCLNGGRFRVEVAWTDFAGKTGVGTAVGLTGDTGYFWFFSNNNVELAVKVLDARGLNSRFWVFYGALSNVAYEMKVTDTLTGIVNTYSNPSGRFASVGDTEGFRTGYSVAAQLDQSRAASKVIPAAGGTLSATAADGTVFTLTVPDGALLSEEEITMTPVASVDRLPLSGGLVAAVQLAPEGLRLFKPATLAISPPAAIPADQETTFAWRGTGEEFFLYPPDPLGTPAISLALFHLSGYGVGRGSTADLTAQLARPPANTVDQLEQNLQDPAAEQRKTLRNGGTLGQAKATRILRTSAKTPAQVAATKELTDFFLHVLEPSIPLTCSDDWKGFVGRLTVFRHRVLTLTGGDPTLLNAVQAYYEGVYKLVADCYDKAYARCKSDKDPFQGEEMGRLWGFLSGAGQGSRVDVDKIQKCLTFELKFDSFIQDDTITILLTNLNAAGATFVQRHTASAVVPLIPASSNGLEAAEGDEVSAELKYNALDFTYTPGDSKCSFGVSGDPSVFTVVRLFIDINVFEGRGRIPLKVRYNPGKPNWTITIVCGEAPTQTLTAPRWREIYEAHHGSEFKSPNFDAKDWKKSGGGDPYAFKNYDEPADVFGKETTTITLKHTPQ